MQQIWQTTKEITKRFTAGNNGVNNSSWQNTEAQWQITIRRHAHNLQFAKIRGKLASAAFSLSNRALALLSENHLSNEMTKSEAPFAAAAATTLSGRTGSRETYSAISEKILLALSLNIFSRRWSFWVKFSFHHNFFFCPCKELTDSIVVFSQRRRRIWEVWFWLLFSPGPNRKTTGLPE